ncbi:MAG: hypothetical protein J0H39_23385 [Alphaproteobacteria bacterium]|nr:hypothetical protein [Alphaproteobacteria bacterium]
MFSTSSGKGKAMDRGEIAIALLRAIGIQELEYSLDGGGDSGDSTLERIQHVDGRLLDGLPDIPTGIDGTGRARTLSWLLDDLVADLPEGDWVNNEGGYGTVIIRPFEEDDDLRFECDMTFREEGDYGGEDDDEEFEDEDFDSDDDGAEDAEAVS